MWLADVFIGEARDRLGKLKRLLGRLLDIVFEGIGHEFRGFQGLPRAALSLE